ncbi:Pre-rRNA-processing protein TSR2 [Cytospora mali]|uniref:Pre-rRNA-processing protein TSR2 n=1 Tax=Cytospora mali TaxID=578113 RepID=A0A194UVI5_CYTMA|nr:Pre-rRNA-processing protein TSR2 [Valsa mali var. pyri (nom. inval.)]
MASAEAPSAATRQSRFEQGVALSLNLWPALTLAVQNNWGGPDSADKRDWFAGQVVEQFPDLSSTSTSTSTPAPAGATKKAEDEAADGEPDIEYVEELILQVMLDEFEVNVDDDSAFDVATEIMRLRTQCARGNFEDVDKLLTRWQSRKGAKVEGLFKKGEDQDNDTDWDDTDGEEGSDDDMDDAPPLVEAPRKEKPPPEVDDDGFTKVSRKR